MTSQPTFNVSLTNQQAALPNTPDPIIRFPMTIHSPAFKDYNPIPIPPKRALIDRTYNDHYYLKRKLRRHKKYAAGLRTFFVMRRRDGFQKLRNIFQKKET